MSGVEQVDMVSLDYDIEHEGWVTTTSGRRAKVAGLVECPETFESVARFLALMPLDARPEVYYHTANPEGERKMRAILDSPPVWEPAE